MSTEPPFGSGTEARARAWHRRRLDLVCDVVRPWEHGTVMRATAYPDYWDFNVVRVEDEPGMTVGELVAEADEALTGLAHRRIDFDLIAAADSRRSEFETLGWTTLRLLYMRHEITPPEAFGLAIEEVPYDAVDELRMVWHREDFPDQGPSDYHAQAREVALSHGARIFAASRDGEPTAFAQLEHDSGSAEITQVYVHPDHRGGGLGTALTRASIEAAGDVEDLWISADDDDRPKDLYGRLGFRPAWLSMEATRLPGGGSR